MGRRHGEHVQLPETFSTTGQVQMVIKKRQTQRLYYTTTLHYSQTLHRHNYYSATLHKHNYYSANSAQTQLAACDCDAAEPEVSLHVIVMQQSLRYCCM